MEGVASPELESGKVAFGRIASLEVIFPASDLQKR
jgi:hypothetical protein